MKIAADHCRIILCLFNEQGKFTRKYGSISRIKTELVPLCNSENATLNYSSWRREGITSVIEVCCGIFTVKTQICDIHLLAFFITFRWHMFNISFRRVCTVYFWLKFILNSKLNRSLYRFGLCHNCNLIRRKSWMEEIYGFDKIHRCVYVST